MELIAVVFMIVAGGAVALFALAAAAIAKEESRRTSQANARASRDEVAASLLYHVLLAGGIEPDDALRQLRREAGLASPVVRGIDILSWGEWYAGVTPIGRREQLLDTAVSLASNRKKLIPLRQYAALLDLSFALGFHTDALARLREKYGFDYVDHAKDARPKEADRRGSMTLFVRDDAERVELLRVLGIEGIPTRQGIIATYRKLAAAHHPDRFHDAPEATQSAETERFIEITRAYEKLLSLYGD